MTDPTVVPTPLADLPLERQVLAGLHAVRPLMKGRVPAPVDELQRSAMAAGAVEWQPRSRADRRM